LGSHLKQLVLKSFGKLLYRCHRQREIKESVYLWISRSF
jgi:hypothetical protein